MVFLTPRSGECQQHLHGFSTGLSCGRVGDPVLLRGVQEVIERDALMGGWWGRYVVQEWPAETICEMLGPAIWSRVDRPNLHYRFYHIRSPLSRHVTMVSVSGLDEEGWVFSVGSACRHSRRESWKKSLLEAVQGRHCVRRLLAQWSEEGQPLLEVPTTFLEHALFYSINRDRLSDTVLENAERPNREPETEETEGLVELREKLGPQHPVLFRNLSPPGLAMQLPEWLVLRVVIPGLQPLHGDHRLPFLGGQLWGPRPCSDWGSVPPHPFA
jgi:ribosomal protein S12 methylthiotransferase accessory factor